MNILSTFIFGIIVGLSVNLLHRWYHSSKSNFYFATKEDIVRIREEIENLKKTHKGNEYNIAEAEQEFYDEISGSK